MIASSRHEGRLCARAWAEADRSKGEDGGVEGRPDTKLTDIRSHADLGEAASFVGVEAHEPFRVDVALQLYEELEDSGAI